MISLQSSDSQESSPDPQFESMNSSILSIFMVQLLTSVHDYQKDLALIIWILVGKVMSLLFNTLSRFVTPFLLRSKSLLISRLQSHFTVILRPNKLKFVIAFNSPPPSPLSDGTIYSDLSFLNVKFQGSFFTLLFQPDHEAL